MKKESSTNLQKYSGIAEQMLKLFSKHPETAKVLFDIIIYGDEGEGNGISTTTEIIHDQLGPGLDPDIFLDVIKDDSKNDEDSNRAK